MRKRSISLLLVLLVLLETVSMTAYAKATDAPEMPYYVAIGDSIAGGYGLHGNETKQLFADFHFLTNVVHNSANTCYPRLVANAIARETTGAKCAQDSEFANLGAPGVAVKDYYDIYKETDPNKRQSYINPFWESAIPMMTKVMAPGEEIDWPAFQWGPTIVEETKKADLITFQLGANDVMQPFWTKMTTHENPLIMLMGYLFKMATLEIDLTKIDLSAALKNLSDGGENGLDLRAMLAGINEDTIRECIEFFNADNFSRILLDSANEVREVYGATLDQVRELNPTAKIIVVGEYNPYGSSNEYHGVNYTPVRIVTQLYAELTVGLPIISRQLLEGIQYMLVYNVLGKTTQGALDRLNEIAQTAAEERGLPFVNIMGKVENEARIAIHPTAKQHAQIADAILEVLLPEIRYGSDTWEVDPFGADAPKQTVYGTEITLTVPAGAKCVTVNHKRVWNDTMKTRYVHFTATEPETIVYAHYREEDACPQAVEWKVTAQEVRAAACKQLQRMLSFGKIKRV